MKYDQICIDLPKGNQLYVKTTPDFYEKVIKHFNLSSRKDITDDHIRMFIYGSFKNAIDKAEKEHLNV